MPGRPLLSHAGSSSAESGLDPDIQWFRPPSKKKFEKNVLTPKTEIWYHAPLAPKQTKDFYPVGSLSVRTLIITKTNETPGEKEHNNPCIHSINSKH
jgi:hypothetical protein